MASKGIQDLTPPRPCWPCLLVLSSRPYCSRHAGLQLPKQDEHTPTFGTDSSSAWNTFPPSGSHATIDSFTFVMMPTLIILSKVWIVPNLEMLMTLFGPLYPFHVTYYLSNVLYGLYLLCLLLLTPPSQIHTLCKDCHLVSISFMCLNQPENTWPVTSA